MAGPFAVVLGRVVMADDAAGGGAQKRMVVGEMARHAADDGTLDAPPGFG